MNSISLEWLESCIRIFILNVRTRDAYYSIEVILVVKNLNGKITTSYFKFRKMRKLNRSVLKFCLRDIGDLQYKLISIKMGRAATTWRIFKIELTNFAEQLDVETIGNRKIKKDNSIILKLGYWELHGATTRHVHMNSVWDSLNLGLLVKYQPAVCFLQSQISGCVSRIF